MSGSVAPGRAARAAPRPRVLVVDEEIPFPLDSGKRIRTFEILRRLAQEFDIRVVCPAPAAPAATVAAFAEAGIGLAPVEGRPPRKSGPRFAWDLLRNLFLRAPYMAMAHRSAAVRAAVATATAGPKGGADLVHVEWTPLVANVPEPCPVPLVISAHNVETEIWERLRDEEPSLPRRAYVALQARKVRRMERRAFARADRVVAVSERDAARIRPSATRGRVAVVPNGVDVRAFAPGGAEEVRPDTLVFVGSLDWRANQDGVLWFAEEVLPIVRARRPGVQWDVVGRAPPPDLVRRLGAAGAAVHASVPDVRPFVRRAAASVVPLRVGGGSRLKICEALALGRPVVSTPVGAEGLDLADGVALGETPQAFAEEVLGVLADPDAAAARAARGRAQVLARYDWDRIAPLQAAAWREALAAPGGRP